MIGDMFRLLARSTGALLASLVACGSRTPLDELESQPDDPPPSCEVNDRVAGGGQWLRRVSTLAGGAQLGVSGSGDLTLVASVSGIVKLDCVELPPVGQADLLLAAFTAEGEVRWAKRLGGPGITLDSFQSGVDAEGNLYLVASSRGGQTRPPIDVGGGAIPSDVFIASFDENGTYRWAHGYEQTVPQMLSVDAGTVGSLGSSSAAIAFQGDLIVDGETFDGGFDTASAQLVLRWDPAGKIVLTRYLAPDSGVSVATMASGPDGSWAIAARTSNGVFVDVLDEELLRWSFQIGSRPAALLFTSSQLIAGGDNANDLTKPFIEALSIDDGEPRWLTLLDSWRGEDESQWPPYATSIIEADGSLVASAPLLGTVDFGLGPLTSAGSFDAMLVRFDVTGQFQTARVLGGSSAESILDMESAQSGRLAITMHGPDGLDLGFGAPGRACEGPCEQLYVGVIDPP